MIPKVPRRPPAPLTYDAADVRVYDGPLWRIHPVGGPYPSRWNEHRTYGPLAGSRWDPHPEPVADHAGRGVLYAATDPITGLGEVFQRRRIVDLAENDRHLTGWKPTRELRLLDLTGTWAVRQQAAAALMSAPTSVTRTYARAIFDELVLDGPQVEGLYVDSTLTNWPMVVLFEPAIDAYPAAPALSRPLHHDDLSSIVRDAVKSLGYGLVDPPTSSAAGAPS